MKAITVFTKSHGINDIRGGAAAAVNYDTGECELQYCLNMALDSDGKLVLSKGPVSVGVEFDDSIVAVTYGSRVVVHAGNKLYVVDELDSATPDVTEIATVVSANVPVIHTNLDFRYCDNDVVYVVANGSVIPEVAAAGTYPGPATSIVYSAMPAFDGGFFYNGVVYTWKGEFVQYSMPWAYDCWDIANNFMWLGSTVLDGACCVGCIAFGTAQKVVAFTGTSMNDFVYSECSVEYKARSLAATASTAQTGAVYFTGSDGIYKCASSTGWEFIRVTKGRVENSFWLSVVSSYVNDISYTVNGTPYSLVLSTTDESVHQVATPDAMYCCLVNNTVLLGINTMLAVPGAVPTEAVVKFASYNFGIPNRKRLQALAITGVIVGDLAVSVQTDDGAIASSSASFNGLVDSAKFKEFRTLKGNNFTVTFVFSGEYFMLSTVHAYVSVLAGV